MFFGPFCCIVFQFFPPNFVPAKKRPGPETGIFTIHYCIYACAAALAFSASLAAAAFAFFAAATFSACSFLGSFLKLLMAPVGQIAAQSPQLLHLSASILARKSSTWMASKLQTVVHFMHPMHALSQFLRATAPLSVDEHRTCT